MSQITVRATTGRPLGSSSSRRLREEGQLPGVVYGRGADPVTVTVDHTELRDALKVKTGMNTVFQLDIDGTPEKVIIKEVQRDPIRRMASHVDFLRVADDEPIKVKVPIKLTGIAKEVAEAGALVEQKLFELPIVVLPTAIPLSIFATACVFAMFGLTINTMTLGGLGGKVMSISSQIDTSSASSISTASHRTLSPSTSM